ncbi:MAG TPA: HEAT repeat domain-containing protein, partial [Planctomycetota bacterium]|nr:HEAT repeat domain-containing protein [Planctomycetota bacterium]
REDYEGCRKLGKAAAPVLATAFREYSDFDRAEMARVMGDLGDPSSREVLVDYLVARQGRQEGQREPRVLVAVLGALSRVGDEAALATLEGPIPNATPDVSRAAESAAQTLRERLGQKR